MRFWQLNRTPIELFGDEIDVGLQAYSIMTTGRDYMGNKTPVMFRSFSEYRLPFQLYAAVPFIKIFGLNPTGVRMTAVLMGLLSLVLFYLLVRLLFDRKLALISSFFMLISPWHFNFSRQANDAGMLLPFVLAGTLFFVKGVKDHKYLLFSAIIFGLSFYSYAIASVFTPLFVISLIIIYRKEIFKIPLSKLTLAGLLGLLVIFPYLIFTVKGISSRRFSSISAIPEPKLMQEVVDKRRWSTSILTRAFYNNKTVAAEIVYKNYLKAFSSAFLFGEGDPNMRQGIEGYGQMYHFDLILLITGGYLFLSSLIKENRRKSSLVILLWLLFSALPSALTYEGGTHASRLILMLPPFLFISALGFKSLLNNSNNLRSKILLVIVLFIMLADITRFYHRYFFIWRNESWRFWQYGFAETITYVKSIDADYSQIFFNNTYEPILPRFLFWYGYDMNKFRSGFSGDVHITDLDSGIDGFKLGDKYYFGDLKKPLENIAIPGRLIVASAEKDATNPLIFEKPELELLKTIKSPTGETIFYIFTGRKI